MSNRTAMTVLTILTAINLIVFGLNLATPSKATVAGMDESTLVADRDFERAVIRVVERFCSSDTGTIHCKY
jgi:hypothetical protein